VPPFDVESVEDAGEHERNGIPETRRLTESPQP
jgi:hypothetical protein